MRPSRMLRIGTRDGCINPHNDMYMYMEKIWASRPMDNLVHSCVAINSVSSLLKYVTGCWVLHVLRLYTTIYMYICLYLAQGHYMTITLFPKQWQSLQRTYPLIVAVDPKQYPSVHIYLSIYIQADIPRTNFGVIEGPWIIYTLSQVSVPRGPIPTLLYIGLSTQLISQLGGCPSWMRCDV